MATITENLQTIKDSTMAIKQAIIDKGGEVGDLTTYADAIINLPSGGGDVNPTAEKNAVTFYDYDGAIIYSYTAEEFLALTEMPPLPRQQGLICQEWNWSFEDAIEYVAEYGVLDVGATYITDDGKTRLYIRIAAEGRMDVPLYFQQTVANGVTIDWGDGSDTETLSGTGKVNTTHRYASIGDYMISLDVAEGCTLNFGHQSSSSTIVGSTDNNNLVYSNRLYKVEIGSGVARIETLAFYKNQNLRHITIPNNIKDIGDYIFQQCISLEFVAYPKNVKTNFITGINSGCTNLHNISFPKNMAIARYTVQNCNLLNSVVLSPSTSILDIDTISTCYSLSSIVIPRSITTVSALSLRNCYGMAFYDFSHHTAVPTLANANAFTSIPDDCKIIVPDALYDEWIAATNWSTYASYIIKKTDWDNL